MIDLPASAERLRFAVRTLPGILSRFSEAESEQRPSPERWTKKEVLGRPLEEAERPHAGGVIVFQNFGAEYVGGQQILRELDAALFESEHFAQRLDEKRAAETRHAGEQHVPAGKDRY